MSSGLHWVIVVVVVLNILGCLWLVRLANRSPGAKGDTSSVTGHTWDGDLQEYNNPLPRWWLWMFYISIVFGFIYLALYPGMGTFKGLLGWSQLSQYEAEVERAEREYAPLFARYAATPLPELAADPRAVAMGQRLFVNYCSACHGSDGGGAPGYPNLTDNDWLYGGTPEAVETSILNGRNGMMIPFSATLQDTAVAEVVAYVRGLSGQTVDPALAAAGEARFAQNCAACHLPDGSGNQALGAPNLTDNIWLYGGSEAAVTATVSNGRNGTMPAHRDLLGEDKVHLLAAYVLSLGGGE
ncbi:MAG: cytochrome-c oxidase, cbb3-type subunit III [Gammaproteobacteria bacterium]|nr:cytochrome-c oxidase, cbb3-type subunit III [Gammaproteobacteria bacterium]